MDISGFELYFLLKLDGVRNLLLLFGAVIALVGGVAMLIAPMVINDFSTDEEEHYKIYRKFVKIYIFIVPALLISGTLLPTTKQMAAIYVLPPIINNEKVQQIPSDLLDILGMGIDKAKEALQPEKE